MKDIGILIIILPLWTLGIITLVINNLDYLALPLFLDLVLLQFIALHLNREKDAEQNKGEQK